MGGYHRVPADVERAWAEALTQPMLIPAPSEEREVLEEVRALRRDVVRIAGALGGGHVQTPGGLWVTPADYLEGTPW